MVRYQAEQRGHDACSDARRRHLDAYQRLRMRGSEALRRGVYHRRVDRRAAQPDKQQSGHRRALGREKHRRRAQQYERLAEAHHPGVAEPHGQEAAQRPANRYAYKEHAGQRGRPFFGHAPAQHKIAARPKPGGLLDCAVAEKRRHSLLRPAHADSFPQGQSLRAVAVRLRESGAAFFPQGQAYQQYGGERRLEQGYVPVAGAPAHSAGQGEAHHIGSDGGSQPPHAVQPAHVPARVVQGDIVVERGVHAPRAQPVGYGPEAKRRVRAADRKPEQRHRRRQHAQRRERPGSEASRQPVALQAGEYGPRRYDGGYRAGVRHRHAKLPIHRRPRRAKQRIRKSQTDEGQIYNRQQKMRHKYSSIF